MKKYTTSLYLMINLLASTHIFAQTATNQRDTDFYKDWKFIKQDVSNAQNPSLSDASWRQIDLPHDWSIEGKFSASEPTGSSFGYLPSGIGWYRKKFSLSGYDLTDKKVFIYFEGIYHQSKVYINGKLLGERFYGYSPVFYDLTPHLAATGENVLAVRVNNTDPDSRWYSGSGIYRDVWLIITDKLHVEHFGTTITTPTAAASAAVTVKTKVKNEYGAAKSITLETVLESQDGKMLTQKTTSEQIDAGAVYEFNQEFTGVPVTLWSPETPVLYNAVSRVIADGNCKDSTVSPFGVRKIAFDKDRGFLLNDKVVLMKGVNIHEDLGCLGTAYYKRAMQRRLKLLKGMGINAIRTSHNPHASNLLDQCDSMGFLVVDEAFDKFSSDFFPSYNQDWKKDLQDFIDRDKNHPCVVQWSVGNEVANDDASRLKQMVDFVHSYEPTRKVSFSWSPHTLNSYFGGDAGLKSQVPLMDVLNINYSEHLLERTRSSIPDKAMIMTEAFVFYRGQGTTIKAYYERNPWLDVVKYDYLAGSFLWSGIDYIGEAVSGWPMHGWNGSAVDLTGYMRPVAWLHKSFTTKEPMVYLAVRHDKLDVPPTTKPHWDSPPIVDHWTLPASLNGQKVKVYAFTNQPTVELTLNGVSQGKKNLADFSDKMMYWEIPYTPGTIRADYGSAENPVTSCVLTTAGPAAKIALSADTQAIVSNGKDVCHIEVQVQDSAGTIVPSATNVITFDVTGSGTLLAVDNGNLQSTEPYQLTNKRSAFYGRALSVVKSSMTPGTISLTASAQGLTSGTIDIKTIPELNTSTKTARTSGTTRKAEKWVHISSCGRDFTISIPENILHTVSIMRANGSSIRKFSSERSATYTWKTASVAHGVYFIFVRSGESYFTKKIFIYK
ncbi:MAG: DUF4982 domain-containing protein [Chitinispirillaceae bacterium]|nr:DUF4982 domain-containing protein [Chitinispirillaceae bacterium]